MDFRLSEEEEKLRKEVHEFFLNELPSDYVPQRRLVGQGNEQHIEYHPRRRVVAQTKEQYEFWLQLQKKFAERGWLAPGWPKEYGGLNMGDMGQGVIFEESMYWGATWPANQGLRVCGPPLNVFGTEEQKKKFLSPIAKGEVVWYQAFTEPDAGTDEANVSLRAVEEGDGWVLNGQKTFISAMGPPDYLYTLAKTRDVEPKHRGLSLFLIDARTPGISYRPLPSLANITAEIYFDDVRVPKDALLGDLNRGFYHAMVTFEFERAATGAGASARRNLEELVDYYKNERRNGEPLIKHPKVRELLADRAIDMVYTWVAGWVSAWYFANRERVGSPPPEAVGLHNKTSVPDRAKQLVDSFGLYGQLEPDSKYAKFEGTPVRAWEISRSTHPAGTTEALKIVLGGRGLGLPRVPREFNKQIAEALKERAAR